MTSTISKPRRRIIPTMFAGLLAAAAIGTTLAPTAAWAADAKATPAIPVTLAVGGKSSVNYLPLTLAEQLGYFKDEGLDVKIADFSSGSKALQSLVGGSADVVMGYYDHTIQMHAKNQDIRAFVQTGRYPGLVMGLTKNFAEKYHGLQDLKGARVGVIGPGSSTHFMLNYMLQKAGVPLDAPSIIAVGVGPMVIAAVKQQKVDVVVNVEPVTTMMERDGDIKVVADTRTEEGTRAVYDGIYPAAVLYARNEYLQKQPEVAEKLTRALVRTLRWISAATPQQIVDAMPHDYYLGDKSLYLAVIEKCIHLYSPDGLIRQEDAETAYRVLKQFDSSVGKAASFDLHQTYTNDFVNRANASLSAAK